MTRLIERDRAVGLAQCRQQAREIAAVSAGPVEAQHDFALARIRGRLGQRGRAGMVEVGRDPIDEDVLAGHRSRIGAH